MIRINFNQLYLPLQVMGLQIFSFPQLRILQGTLDELIAFFLCIPPSSHQQSFLFLEVGPLIWQPEMLEPVWDFLLSFLLP